MTQRSRFTQASADGQRSSRRHRAVHPARQAITDGFRRTACVAAALLVACASSPVVPPPPPESPPAMTPLEPGHPSASEATTGLVLRATPAGAELLIDGRSYGKVSGLPQGHFVPLPPGFHQLVLRLEGYYTWRAEVSIRSGQESIDVALERQP